MEDVKHIGQTNLDGQTTLPGFESGEPTPPEAEGIKQRVHRVAFSVDYLKNPEDAIIAYNVPDGYLTRYLQDHFNRLVKTVAEMTGADPEQIANKETRTPEQDRLLTEVAGREQLARITAFLDSTYMDAISVLEPLAVAFQDPTHKEYYTVEELPADFDPNVPTVKDQAVLYFFATHESIVPTSNAPLTDDQRQDLIDLFHRMDAFFVERAAAGYEYTGSTDFLYAFIEHENPTPESAESIVEKLTSLQGLTPTAHTMPNNPLMNALQQKHIIEPAGEGKGWDLIVANATTKRKEITAFVMATYDPGDTGIQITDAKLTEHERQVSDAVVSLWIEATQEKLPPIFTVSQIFRAMPGGSDQPSPQQKGAITKTLEKFSRLHIYMDATEEMRRRGIINDQQKWIVDEDYLMWRRHTVTTKNGKKIAQGYQIVSQPIMLTYSNLTKQLLTVPAKNIAIEKVKHGVPSGELIAMSADRQAMTGYIVRRLATMKHDHEKAKDNKRKYDAKRKNDPTLEDKPLSAFAGQEHTIKFETLFTESGVATANRDRTMDNRNFCFDVLEYQKAIGYIKGYEKQTKGRTITGVKIEF